MRTALVLASLLALSSGTAFGSNTLYIAGSDDLRNVASLDVVGDGNALYADQTFLGSGAGNTLTVKLVGDFNGGSLNAKFDAPVSLGGLVPGRIIQSGHANAIDMEVVGSSNLFAVTQIGVSNSLTAAISGNYNQAAVAQYGSHNSLAFTQNGSGNVLSVIQRSQ